MFPDQGLVPAIHVLTAGKVCVNTLAPWQVV
jgi:hypothetical protein